MTRTEFIHQAAIVFFAADVSHCHTSELLQVKAKYSVDCAVALAKEVQEEAPFDRMSMPLTGKELAEKFGFEPHSDSGASQVIGRI